MKQQRADLGFGQALKEFDPSEFAPKARLSNDRPKKDVTQKIAAAAGFQSRQPVKTEPEDERAGQAKPRRRRTGRNQQLNLKVKPETVENFYAIADQKGWGLGETLEYALEALEAHYKSLGKKSS